MTLSCLNIQQGVDAVDALHKIASLLNAALHLNTSNPAENAAMAELIGIAEDLANRVIDPPKAPTAK